MMKNRDVGYKKELEAASRSMILIRDPRVLIKLIIHTIVDKVGIEHAGILLYDETKKAYILTVSGGVKGLKIPAGFARIDIDSPLISFYTSGFNKMIFGNEVLEIRGLNMALASRKIKPKDKDILKKIQLQMEIFAAAACVPIFFRDSLLGVLLLGKKDSHGQFRRDELNFFNALALDAAMALRNARFFEEMHEELEKRRDLFMHTTIALAAAIDAKDHYTHGHTSRVINYSLSIAEELKKQVKLDAQFMESLHIAALLHDIGKIGVPEMILNKVSPLTDEERAMIKQHPMIGVTIIEPIKELKDSLPGIKYHHERYDGTGYPEGLKGKNIPLIALIISVADSFDAISTDRPYRNGLTMPEAMQELIHCSGAQFDPDIICIAQNSLLK